MIGASAIGVPGWPELAAWTASMDKVRIVFTHSSSSARWSVPTDMWLLRLDCVRGTLQTRAECGRAPARACERGLTDPY